MMHDLVYPVIVITQTKIAGLKTQRFTHRKKRVKYQLLRNDTQQATAYAYDGLDRLVKLTNPDATFSTVAYSLAPAASTDISVVTATDETSKVQSFTLDASAKLVKRSKMKGATPLTTSR